MKDYIKYIFILVYIVAIAFISGWIMNAKLESAKTSSYGYGEDKILIETANHREAGADWFSYTRTPTIIETISYAIKSNIFLIVFNMLISIIIYLIMYCRKIIKINIKSISLMALVILLPVITNIIQLFSMYAKLAIEVVH